MHLRSFGLHPIPAEKILDAVLYVDVSHIDCSGADAQDQGDEPDIVLAHLLTVIYRNFAAAIPHSEYLLR